MVERTFNGLAYEWSQDIRKENPHKRVGSITLKDISKLKRKLKKQLLYEVGFDECVELCVKAVKHCSVNGKLDIEDSANFLIDKIRELNGSLNTGSGKQ